jgi:FlaG/FlaF family flagellin (archaellin)
MQIGHFARRVLLAGTVASVVMLGVSGCFLGKSDNTSGQPVSENGGNGGNGGNNGGGNGACVTPQVKLSPSNAIHARGGQSIRITASLPVDQNLFVQSASVVLARAGTTESTVTNSANQFAYAQVGGVQANGQTLNLSFSTTTSGTYPVILLIQWGNNCSAVKTIGSVTIS